MPAPVLRFGTVPILWNNDDLPQSNPPVPFETVIAEMAEAGFTATELGSNYPRDGKRLREALAQRGLVLSGAYYCPGLTDVEAVDSALPAVDAFLDFLVEAGCETLLVAEPVTKARSAIAGRVHAAGGVVGLTDAQWATLGDALNQLGTRCKTRGLALAFHNHAGTWVETPNELKRLMNLTDPALVGLCLDTGHCVYGGGNPLEVIDTYRNRLRYMHLKDIDPGVMAGTIAEQGSFLDALAQRVFTELGIGCVDLEGVAAKLREIGYSGWVVAEQDTSHLKPLVAARMNHHALTRLFNLSHQAQP